MSGKRAQKRAALKADLIQAAVARIEQGGTDTLRARDLAAEVGLGG